MSNVSHIEIENKSLPFSNESGVKTVLLGSDLILQCYPTKVISSEFTLLLSFDGPCEDFLLFNDFEKGKITIICKLERGFFRYSLSLHDSGVFVLIEKDKVKSLKMEVITDLKKEEDKKSILIHYKQLFLKPKSLEKLSLGNHKKQDMRLIQRRLDLKEILPLWFLAGQWTRASIHSKSQKTLLGEVERAVNSFPADKLSLPFLHLYKASFSGIFAPRTEDEDYQGFSLPLIEEGSAFSLLHEGMKLIRALFIRSEHSTLILLPKLPSEFPSGRMIRVHALEDALQLNFEWTKFNLRKVVLKSLKKCHFNLILPSKIKTFRLRKSLKEKGIVIDPQTLISMDASQTLFLDRFIS